MRPAEQLTQPPFTDPLHHTTPHHPTNTIVEGEEQACSVADLYVGKEDVIQSRPDLEPDISRLSDTDIEATGLQTEAAMGSIISMVLSLTVANYLQREHNRRLSSKARSVAQCSFSDV
jgi:hypothetical protein